MGDKVGAHVQGAKLAMSVVCVSHCSTRSWERGPGVRGHELAVQREARRVK